MVLRSGIIIPFQFRDNKKLLMIGVPEENRDLSIWDLKNVVRAAFGIYNFEFRNKKIGFNIPDELLLNYLAQRHDLTNFVIEVGQVYESTGETHCTSCRCLPAPQKCTGEDLSRGPVNLQSHQRRYRHSSSSSSRHSNSPPPPPIVATAASKKRRHTLNTNEIHTKTEDTSEGSSHLQMETKIEYDYMNNEDEAPSMGTPSVVNVAAYQDEAPNPEINFERLQMQHEFYLKHQQQQQHHQQQLQQHMEALLHDRPNNSLRQRKERMSRKQKEVYVTYLEQTPIMSEYKRNDPFLDAHWQKLTGILNSVPQGAIKSMNEWKQAFDNWRFRIYLYARFNSKITGDAVLNPKNFKPLTITDKRAYSLWIRNPDTAPPDLDKMRNIFVNLDETPQE